jgi:ribonuclease BN (tRNA processing enzyme)
MFTYAGEGHNMLRNDGELDVIFLGVGSAFSLDHHQTSILIVKGDAHVLVDFGMSGPASLSDVHLTMADILIVLPTHSHSDHVGGLESLALYNRYVATRHMGRPKLKCVVTPEYQRILWDYTLKGGLEWNEEQPDGRRRLGFGDFFDIIPTRWKTSQPREIHEVGVGDIKLELFRTNHIPEQAPNWEASFVSYGLMIDDKVFFSSDSQFDPELLKLYKDAEHFFHDVQFFPGAVHAPLADLKTLPKKMKERMTLMHYADNYKEHPCDGFAGYAIQGAAYRFGKPKRKATKKKGKRK